MTPDEPNAWAGHPEADKVRPHEWGWPRVPRRAQLRILAEKIRAEWRRQGGAGRMTPALRDLLDDLAAVEVLE